MTPEHILSSENHKQPLDTTSLLGNFWFAIPLITGTFISLVIACFILGNSRLYFCLEPECFSLFLKLIDVPIKIISATLAYAVFFAVVHRSNQTNLQINLAFKQIELVLDQNSFKNYLDHKNEFIRILTELENDNQLSIRNKEDLYIRLFPKNNTQKMNVLSVGENDEKSELIFLIEEFNKLIREYNTLGVTGGACEVHSLKNVARWMGEFLNSNRKVGVHSEITKNVSSGWEGCFGIYTEVPVDMNNYIYECKKVLDQLQHFALPNQKIKIEDRIYSEDANKHFMCFCETIV
jgi:hypothetical protein